MSRLAVRTILIALLALLACPLAVQADEARARDVYVRRKIDIAETVAWLVSEARLHRVGQLLVVFDAASFSPPPGATEFSAERVYTNDLDAWIDALGNEVANAPCPLRATSSLAPRSIKVGDPVWKQDLRDLVTRKWWEGGAVSKMEPAAKWMNRLLKVTESAIGPYRGEKRRMLALISGSITPERWTFLGDRPSWESHWRLKLQPVGTYWNEEDVATLLQRDGCRFYCIAPEVFFGDFRPFIELPQLPWVARPQVPAAPVRRAAGSGHAHRRRSGPRLRRGRVPEDARRALQDGDPGPGGAQPDGGARTRADA